MNQSRPVRLRQRPGDPKSPFRFFGLVFALSVPFWAAGALTARQLLPALPISALGFICPAAAAAMLTYRESGTAAVAALLKRSFDLDRIKAKGWLVVAIALQPGVMGLSYLAIRLAGTPVPAPQLSLLPALGLLLAFFVAALGEELGWSGYAIDPLQERYGALLASFMVGCVWAVWHYIPLLQAGRSPAFIAWWSLGTLASRVLIVWLYNNTGKSVFVAAVFHAMINLTWQLFPVNGSFYDPRVTGLAGALVAAVVVIGWGPRWLSRARSAG